MITQFSNEIEGRVGKWLEWVLSAVLVDVESQRVGIWHAAEFYLVARVSEIVAGDESSKPIQVLLELVRPEGFEPPTYWFEASRSIRVSYGRATGS